MEHYLDLCAYAEQQVEQAQDLEMAVPRESFNICFRYIPPQGIPLAAFNKELRERMHRTGRSLVGTGLVNGELVLRLLITNVNVDKPQIDTFFQSVIETGRALLAERSGPNRTH